MMLTGFAIIPLSFVVGFGVDYARAEATLDTAGATVQQSFAKLQKLVTPWMRG